MTIYIQADISKAEREHVFKSSSKCDFSIGLFTTLLFSLSRTREPQRALLAAEL